LSNISYGQTLRENITIFTSIGEILMLEFLYILNGLELLIIASALYKKSIQHTLENTLLLA